MIVNLIEQDQMFTVNLPSRVKGQFWLSDIDDHGRKRDLIGIEAVDGRWLLKSNRSATVLDHDNRPVSNELIVHNGYYNVTLYEVGKKAFIFAEDEACGGLNFHKYVATHAVSFYIGRNLNNNIFVNNKFVSGRHAKLSFNGERWYVADINSSNGTYVNGYRVTSQNLLAGDMIYIMGLKIIIGSSFIAINDPDNSLHINSDSLVPYSPQSPSCEAAPRAELPPADYFYRSPRFYSEAEHKIITIDPPPQRAKDDGLPMAMMLGPSMTMGLASASTGAISMTNVIVNGGSMMQALPMVIMSGSMLVGTVLWPILTKKHEKKVKAHKEEERQKKYLEYLEQVRDEIRRALKEQSDSLNTNLADLNKCISRIAERKPSLWERMPSHSDFLRIRIGTGNIPLDAEVKCQEKHFTMDSDNLQDAMYSLAAEKKMLMNVPIGLELTKDNKLGIFGSFGFSFNFLKVMLVQIFSLHSYDEVKIMLLTDSFDEREWNFLKWIPHLWDDNKQQRFFASDEESAKELSAYIEKNILTRPDKENSNYTAFSPYYIIISTSKMLAEKCEGLKKLIAYKNNPGFSVIMLEEELKDLPKEINSVIAVTKDRTRIFNKNDTSDKGISFERDKINVSILPSLSEDTANIELDLRGSGYTLPDMMTFLEMFKVGKIEYLNSLVRWKENNPTKSLKTVIGVDSHGEPFYLDLHEKYHGPHGLVAGMTGSGKSEFIITYILSLAVNYHPNEVAFILIDYKGGGLTGAFEDPERGIKLPHLAGTITNLDGAAVKRSLISIQSELRRRQAVFNRARRISGEGTMDIYKYQQLFRDKIVDTPVPHLFIISDEFAELKTQQPEFMEQLISAARIGRSLGVHLILATQKPSGVVDDQIWSNSRFRVCLKVQEKADSQDMIKCPDAAELSQTGRFYLQVGFNELFALGQSAWCGADYLPTDEMEKQEDPAIQVVDNLGRVVMNVKKAKKNEKKVHTAKQVVAIVKYLSDLAKEEKINERPLWLDPIPAKIYLDDIEKKYHRGKDGIKLEPVIGEYDDPFNQRQSILTLPISELGNCLIYGAAGSGKTTLMTTICCGLIKNHTPDEVNIYIIDFGSQTLKAFEKAPHVGGVVLSSDEEKLINLLKMLLKETERRKTMFSEYGGDFKAYCKNSGRTLPNILVALNNFPAFAEQYEELVETFNLLTRDGIKYGIYFLAAVGSVNGIRYKTAQNFKQVLTLQLNDTLDYSVVLGKTDGLVPTACKGRGLVRAGGLYEFQTAFCTETADEFDYIKDFCEKQSEQTKLRAVPIPILPKTVDSAAVSAALDGLRSLPVGISKKTLDIMTVNLQTRVLFAAAAADAMLLSGFAAEFAKQCSKVCSVFFIDAHSSFGAEAHIDGVNEINSGYDEFAEELFAEMVKRNNTYKDAGMDLHSLDDLDERIYIIFGVKKFFERLGTEALKQFKLLIEKCEPCYKIKFVILDEASAFSNFSFDEWYKRHISVYDALWVGDGVTDQYLFKISKLTNELYKEIGGEYGYLINRGKPVLIKLLTDGEKREE